MADAKPSSDPIDDVEPVTELDPDRIRGNLERIREQAGPEVEILAASKYIRAGDMGALAEGGLELVGENRLQDLEASASAGAIASPGTSSATCRAARSSGSCRWSG